MKNQMEEIQRLTAVSYTHLQCSRVKSGDRRQRRQEITSYNCNTFVVLKYIKVGDVPQPTTRGTLDFFGILW